MRYTRAPRSAALAIAVVAIAGLLAACGSSSNTSSSSSSAAAASSGSGSASSSGSSATRTAARTKLAACLKQHGVTLPTRPAGAGTGGGYGGPPAGGAPGAGGGGGYGSGGGGHFFGGGGGAFRSNPKFQAAFKACGGRTFARPGGFHLSHAAIGKFVSCVKQHGYNLPAPNFSGKGSVFPASIERNAKFQAASRACRSALMPPGGSPPGGATTTG